MKDFEKIPEMGESLSDTMLFCVIADHANYCYTLCSTKSSNSNSMNGNDQTKAVTAPAFP